MPGRKPKPTAIKELEGNPGKRKINKQEPIAPDGCPPKPMHLTPAASHIWDETVPVLAELKTLKTTDGDAIEAYCEAFAMYRKAIAEVEKNGITITSPQGPKKNPAVTVASENVKIVKAFMSEFGLTPSARTRINTGESGKGKELTPLERLLAEQAANRSAQGSPATKLN